MFYRLFVLNCNLGYFTFLCFSFLFPDPYGLIPKLFMPDNYKVRLKPKLKISPSIERLLKKEAKNHRLTLKQTRLLRKYKLAKSMLMVTCSTCSKVSKYAGESRHLLANGPGTPKTLRVNASTDLRIRTPGSSRKTNLSHSEEKLSSKGKSPVLTPRSCVSAQSSPATPAKSSKKGKFQFSKLKMLLSQEEREPSKKGNLQNFLSSLA
uniref:Chromosome 18 open reading frame 21 n=1 Tax=Xenopus tropicalis TaxID=8364 RepID=A0A803JRP1_XENTR